MLSEIIRSNYATYKAEIGLSSRLQFRRLFIYLVIAIVLALLSSAISSSFSIIVTALTILTGFTFTALFSSQLLADVGLPSPGDETDREDLVRLGKLAKNFTARSRFFILVSILLSVLLVLGSLELSLPTAAKTVLLNYLSEYGPGWYDTVPNIAAWLRYAFTKFAIAVVLVLFFECLYTFFRLSETIVSILDVRRAYIKSSEQR